MLNVLLLILVFCLGAFLFAIYLQISKIENSLKSLQEEVETYLLKVYGEED